MVRWLLLGPLTWSLLLLACSAELLPEVGDSCASIADCAGGDRLACMSGICRRLACERSATCPFGAACVGDFCQSPQCVERSDCAAGSLCFEGVCRSDVCASKADCAAEEVCLGVPPTCGAPPASCRRDEECTGVQGCKLPEGRCEERCVDDDACPGVTYCDGEFCRPSCASDGDCRLGDVCADGRCIPEADCSSRPPCEPAAPHRQPATCACTECLVDLDCDVQSLQACTSAGRCRYCVQRTREPATCSSQGLFYEDGCCVECVDDADCSEGRGLVCERGRCDLPPLQECEIDADCAEPKACDAGRCVLPGSGAACDRQSACPPGEGCYSDGRCGVASERCEACPSPSRCVAEPGETQGTCAGCTAPCAASGCPDGQLCVIPDGQNDGYCADAAFAPECR